MNLSEISLESLVCLITGSNAPVDVPYLSGPEIVSFFNKFGITDEYTSDGLPGNVSRTSYTETTLKKLNGSKQLPSLIEALVDCRRITSFEKVAERVNSILKYDGYSLVPDKNNIYRIHSKNPATPAEIEAKFENIKSTIMENINNSSFLIWVAVAWFTDKDLGNALWLKYKKGLSIRIIVNDDQITKQYGLDFNKTEMPCWSLSPSSAYGKALMHNKFAIFDLETVIHGSYNWTNRAQYNNETITTIKDQKVAREFANEFIKLQNSL